MARGMTENSATTSWIDKAAAGRSSARIGVGDSGRPAGYARPPRERTRRRHGGDARSRSNTARTTVIRWQRSRQAMPRPHRSRSFNATSQVATGRPVARVLTPRDWTWVHVSKVMRTASTCLARARRAALRSPAGASTPPPWPSWPGCPAGSSAPPSSIHSPWPPPCCRGRPGSAPPGRPISRRPVEPAAVSAPVRRAGACARRCSPTTGARVRPRPARRRT